MTGWTYGLAQLHGGDFTYILTTNHHEPVNTQSAWGQFIGRKGRLLVEGTFPDEMDFDAVRDCLERNVERLSVAPGLITRVVEELRRRDSVSRVLMENFYHPDGSHQNF